MFTNICPKCGEPFRSSEQIVQQIYCNSCEYESRSHKEETKSPEPTENEKAAFSLDLKALYRRVYDWHKQNHNLILHKKQNPDYVQRYLKLVKEMPIPENATQSDIAFISHEVTSGLMEWAYGKKDQFGIELRVYASLITNKLGEEFQTLRFSSGLSST